MINDLKALSLYQNAVGLNRLSEKTEDDAMLRLAASWWQNAFYFVLLSILLIGPIVNIQKSNRIRSKYYNNKLRIQNSWRLVHAVAQNAMADISSVRILETKV